MGRGMSYVGSASGPDRCCRAAHIQRSRERCRWWLVAQGAWAAESGRLVLADAARGLSNARERSEDGRWEGQAGSQLDVDGGGEQHEGLAAAGECS